jgi:hypothetical protein
MGFYDTERLAPLQSPYTFICWNTGKKTPEFCTHTSVTWNRHNNFTEKPRRRVEVKLTALKAIEFCSVWSRGGKPQTNEIFLSYSVHWQSATRCLVTECLHNDHKFSTLSSVWDGNLKCWDPWQMLNLSSFSVSHRNRSRILWTILQLLCYVRKCILYFGFSRN